MCVASKRGLCSQVDIETDTKIFAVGTICPFDVQVLEVVHMSDKLVFSWDVDVLHIDLVRSSVFFPNFAPFDGGPGEPGFLELRNRSRVITVVEHRGFRFECVR